MMDKEGLESHYDSIIIVNDDKNVWNTSGGN